MFFIYKDSNIEFVPQGTYVEANSDSDVKVSSESSNIDTKESSGKNDECAICTEDLAQLPESEIHTNVCKHTFCKKCMDRWAEELLKKGKDVTCPICRNVEKQCSREQSDTVENYHFHNRQPSENEVEIFICFCMLASMLDAR